MISTVFHLTVHMCLQAVVDYVDVVVLLVEVVVEGDEAEVSVEQLWPGNNWTTSWTPTCQRPKVTWMLNWMPTWLRQTQTVWSDHEGLWTWSTYRVTADLYSWTRIECSVDVVRNDCDHNLDEIGESPGLGVGNPSCHLSALTTSQFCINQLPAKFSFWNNCVKGPF